VSTGRILIVAGVLLIVVGLAWPWLAKLPLGRLPGDIAIERPHVRFYFPVTTMIVVSLVVTFLLWLFRR
jgi:hypothetical protein